MTLGEWLWLTCLALQRCRDFSAPLAMGAWVVCCPQNASLKTNYWVKQVCCAPRCN